MATFQESTLTESSDDASSDDSRPKKKVKMFNMPDTECDVQVMSDRSSTNISVRDDDTTLALSDDDNPMIKLMKESKPKGYVGDKAKKMMEKMGYMAGKGLGKHSQGRVDPVEFSRQRGRRGLGTHLPGLEAADLEWNSDMEVVSVEETVSWLEEECHEPLTEEILSSWYKEGPRKMTIDDETIFCDSKLLKNILNCKSVFDKLDVEEMKRARSRSNPFETIRGAIFLNRAAMKMANMDSVFDFMFTFPKDQSGNHMIAQGELLYFADVCAGPGGFSEYVLWRRKWYAKGFGFTLKGDNDFKLFDFFAGPSEVFEPYYGVDGINGDGNVFNPDNIIAFKSFVMDQTDYKGVHFMMADGGFSVDGQENIQEILSKQLYLCQFLVALCIVREGGHFVCKLFDLFTPFSVGLVYLMYKAFKKISIHKPNTSRPANSERYIICKWKRVDSKVITDYLFRICGELWKLSTSSPVDVTDIVSLTVLQEDKSFFDYVVKSNNKLGQQQVVNLVKIAAFCRDTSLTEMSQAQMRLSCLKYWKVPDETRTYPSKSPPEEMFEQLLKTAKTTKTFMNKQEVVLSTNNLCHTFQSVYDWHCVVMGSSKGTKNCTFYLGLGRNRVFRWESNKWKKVIDNLELCPGTLLYAEMVQELRGEGRSQSKLNTLHIIDAMILGGIVICNKHLTERRELCNMFAKAHYKPSRNDLIRIRVKELHAMETVASIFERLERRIVKGGGCFPRTVFTLGDKDDLCFVPNGLLFIKATQEPWHRHRSKKTKVTYYHNASNKESFYENDRPPNACADFMNSFSTRCIWWWDEDMFDSEMEHKKNMVLKDDLLKFVQEKCLV